MKRPLTCAFVNKLDKDVTLPSRRGPKAARRRGVRGGLCLSLMLGLGINTINISNANAYPLKRYQQDWALVAMNHLGDLQEAQCWVELIWRESRFDPNARNGSHYGLAQMRNENVRTLKPRDQVRWHMRYLDHRYPKANGKGSACKALNHMNRKGWH
jgi:hypothetical protein